MEDTKKHDDWIPWPVPLQLGGRWRTARPHMNYTSWECVTVERTALNQLLQDYNGMAQWQRERGGDEQYLIDS